MPRCLSHDGVYDCTRENGHDGPHHAEVVVAEWWDQTGTPGSVSGHGPDMSHSSPRNVGLSSIHSGNAKSISIRASASRASIPSTVTPTLTER